MGKSCANMSPVGWTISRSRLEEVQPVSISRQCLPCHVSTPVSHRMTNRPKQICLKSSLDMPKITGVNGLLTYLCLGWRSPLWRVGRTPSRRPLRLFPAPRQTQRTAASWGLVGCTWPPSPTLEQYKRSEQGWYIKYNNKSNNEV